MAKQVMHRQAADNVYLHKDFHAALSFALDYVEDRYDPQAVRDYLRQFAAAFYAPLTAALKSRGLVALQEHLQRIYQIEGGQASFEGTDDELVVRVAACPAVQHIRTLGMPVARSFSETTRTVNQKICEGTPFAAELVEYDEQTGRSVQRFYRVKR